MKKIILGLIYFCSSWIGLYAQGNDTYIGKDDPNLYVHWFYIKAETKIDRNLNAPVYVVRISSKNPKSGTMTAFQKDGYRSLINGQQLAIGPFLNYKEALRALSFYDLARHTEETMAVEIANYKDTTEFSEYFYYYLEYRLTDRTHKYVFKRIPAAVASGSLAEFRQVLWEGLTQKKLCIGPFTTQEEAEESKRLYRLEEEE